MEQLLFINACVRGERSRTLKLARRFLENWQRNHSDGVITQVDLCKDRPVPQYPEVLAQRDELWNAGKLDDPMFDLARQFAAADRIVVAAPFWDLSFPAILKIYLERISVTNITFGYDEQGNNVGLCKADKLLLITTRGGNFSLPETTWMEMGARQLEALCAMYGIPSFQCLAAEGLDDIRNDKKAILAEAMGRADAMAEVF
ncbi:flavodoxin [Flavonifractor sp. An52]|uniref:FMN-dependent NADH-azoreductase n=1 Tax=Flavonifractor sp. An52 TaxID=1965642 RepID=UPI000B3A4699|nr:NAD(P)H-dependent oxidoreductase [Flavonifractor sp. An52]OUN86451.1 flavodoxin [Flavonifractor sp. An52]